MARLWTCGWESGDPNEAGVLVVGASAAVTAVASNPTPRAGAYCLKYVAASNQFLYPTFVSLVLPAPSTELWVRCAVYMHGLTTAENGLVRFVDGAGPIQNTVTWSGLDGLLRLYRGPMTNFLAASTAAMGRDGWHVIEVRSQMSSLTSGISEVWLDGSRVINYSGDNVGSPTLATMQLVHVGFVDGGAATVAPAGSFMAFDDLAVNDTSGSLNNGRPGDGRVVMLLPNGVGSVAVLVRGGTDTGANYSQVNEIPPSVAQYVGSATIGDRDLYALSDLGVAVSSINVVEALALAQNADAGAGQLAPTLKSGPTVSESAAQSLSTSPTYRVARWETDPNTSAAWTAAAVNLLEVGVTVR